MTIAEELNKAQKWIQNLEEELARGKEFVALMSNMGQSTSSRTEPVEPDNPWKKALEKEVKTRASIAREKECQRENELQMLREELATQEALRERERDHNKTTEEEKQRTEESL